MTYQYKATSDETFRESTIMNFDINKNESVVQVISFALCGSDIINIEKSKEPILVGHEWYGRIVKTNSESFLLGDYVTSSPFIGCGHCTYCKEGLSNLCSKSKIFGNEIAASCSHLILPNDALFKIPSHFKNHSIMIEPFAVGLSIYEQIIKLNNKNNILVIGLGAIGVIIEYLLHKNGFNIIGVDISKERNNYLIKNNFKLISSEQLKKDFYRHFDVVIDCAGGFNNSSGAWEYLPNALSKGGTLIAVGKYSDVIQFDINNWGSSSSTIKFIRGFPHSFMGQAIKYHQLDIKKLFDLLVNNELSISALNSAIKIQQKQGKVFRQCINHEN